MKSIRCTKTHKNMLKENHMLNTQRINKEMSLKKLYKIEKVKNYILLYDIIYMI